MEGFKTEEFGKRRFPFKKALILFLLVLIVIFGIVLVVYFVSRPKKEAKVKESNVNYLNSELSDTYAFAKEDDYLVALKKDGQNKRIYNLSQGTANLGDFLDYTYYDKKLWLLFGTDNIYSISLTAGNGVYELENEYTYLPAVCGDNSSGRTSNIVVNSQIIYFNNSNCSISGINYQKNKKQVNLKVFNSLQNSSMVYSDSLKTLFFQGDNAIYKIDETKGDVEKVLDSVNGNIPLTITDNVLLYTSTSDNILYNYYGYNIATKSSAIVAKDVNKLAISKKRYFYLKDNKIYVNSNNKVKEVYSARYDKLSDFELIAESILQIVDSSDNGDKKRIVNIDLDSDKFTTKVVSNKYSLIRNVK